jgi:hypothetical protein
MHRPDGAAISNPPLRRHHGARPRCEQRRGKALDTFSDDRDATRGPASGKHYQIRLEVEAREMETASRRIPAAAARRMLRLLHRLTDLPRSGDGIIDVARERFRLLGCLGEVTEDGGDAGGTESQQIESDVLHGEHAGFQVARDL